MDDLISREEVLSKMAEYVASGYADSEEDFQAYTNIVAKLPSAQKTGKWIHKREYGLYPYDILTCSACGETDARMYRSDEYCPHCGARMVGEEE